MAITARTLRLAQELKTRTDQIVDSATRVLVANWADAWAEINSEWQQAVDQIISRRLSGEELTPAQIMRLERAQNAVAITADKLRELAGDTDELLVDQLAHVISITDDLTGQVVLSQTHSRMGVTWTRADAHAIEAIVTRHAQQIHAATWPLADDAVTALHGALLRAVPAGWSPDRTAREMLARTQTAFNGGLARAMTLARTELLDAHRAAAQAAELNNRDIMAGWLWHATLDTRTCPACWAKHGTLYDLDEPGPLGHQNCRCARTPKTKSWRELGFDIDEPDSMFPDRDQAWAALTAGEKRDILGPTRYELLNDGDIALDDLATRRHTPAWRDSYTVTPLDDLKRRTA